MRHVLIGLVFTAVGLFTLFTPEVPFICIGALIFGPIELFVGLLGSSTTRRVRYPLASAPSPPPYSGTTGWPTTKFCPQCGMKTDGIQTQCMNCGADLP